MTDQGSFANIGLRWVVDQGSLSQVKQSLDSVRTNLTDLGGEAAKDSSIVKQLSDASASVGRDATIANVAKDYVNLGNLIKDDTAALAQMQEALRGVGAASADIDKATVAFKAMADAQAEAQGDGSGGGIGLTGLRRTGGALRQLGLGAIGEPIQKIGDLGQVMKELSQVSEAAGVSVSAAGVAFGGVEVALGPLLLVLLPVAAAVAGVVAEIKSLSDSFSEINKVLEAAKASVDAYYGALDKGTTDSLQKQLTDLDKQKTDIDAKVATITNSLSGGFESAKQIEVLGVKIGDAGARMVTAAENAGAFGGGVQGVSKDLEDAKKQSNDLSGQIDGLKRALGSSAVAANDAAEAEQKLADARDKAAEKGITQAKADAQLTQTGTSKGIDQQISDIHAEREAITNELLHSDISTKERLKLQDDLGDLADRENKLTGVILPAIQARESQIKAQQEADAALSKSVQLALTNRQLEDTATAKSVRTRIDGIDAEKQAINDAMATHKASAAETQKLKDRLAELAGEESNLTNTVLPAVIARERADAEKKREESLVSTTEKYNSEVKSIEESSLQERANLNQHYADEQVKIAEKAVDAAKQSLQKLEQKYEDLATTDQRDLSKFALDDQRKKQDEVIKFNRQEVQDLQQHLDNLKQIRDRDQGRERDDLLNRNYRDLFSLREQKVQDVDKENTRYSQQAQSRVEALNQAVEDETRQYARLRQDRQIAYAQAQADAQRQYAREIQQEQENKVKELQAAREAHVIALRDLRQKENNELLLKRQAAIEQLRLIQQTEAAKRQVFQQTLDQAYKMLGQTRAQAQVQNVVSTIGSVLGAIFGQPAHRAGGGSVLAGQPYMVNDDAQRRTESFNGTPFPPGLGMFIPAQSGNVQSGGSGPASITINMPITGVTDPVAVGRIARQQTHSVIKEYFK